jgi:hypothetical protein
MRWFSAAVAADFAVLCSLEVQSQHQEQQRVAIHSTYPLMRAARLLEAVGSMRIADAENDSSGSGSRPWPCFDAGAWQHQQQQCGKDSLPLLKLPADMTAAERNAAGAAAAAWLAEQARSQEMVAQLLERAQQSEMALAAAKLAADGSQQKQQEQQLLLSSANGGCTSASAGWDNCVCTSLRQCFP